MLRKFFYCLALLVLAGPAIANDRAKGEASAAIATASEAIRRDPRDASAYYNRGNAYSDKGEADRAIADYTTTIRLDPAHVNAHYNRGNAYSNKGDAERAIADYTATIRLDPAYANAYYNRGNAFSKKCDTDRAIADYTEAVRLQPMNANAYVNRGLAYEKRGDFAKARADFNATLGLTQSATRWALDKARERLAVLPAPRPATILAEKPSVPPAVLAPGAANGDRRIALVIGNSAYENVAALPNPVPRR